MEVGAGDEKNDKNDKLDDEKKKVCPDDTTPDGMEVGAGDEKMTRMINLMMKKEAACPDEETSEGENTDYVIPTVNDKEGTDLTISVDMEEGVAKKRRKRVIE